MFVAVFNHMTCNLAPLPQNILELKVYQLPSPSKLQSDVHSGGAIW